MSQVSLLEGKRSNLQFLFNPSQAGGAESALPVINKRGLWMLEQNQFQIFI